MDKTKNNLQTSSSSILTNKFFFLLLVFSFAVKSYLFRDDIYTLDLNAWHTHQLTMDYSYGFIRRGLLGSFASLIKQCFNIEYPTALKTVQIIGVLLFSISILLFFSVLLKNENEKAFRFIALLYIALDHAGFELTLFGLLDTYIMAITLLMVYLIIKDKALFLIPFFAGVCVLIHEAYPMMFFAVIVSLLIYRFCYAEDKRSKIKYASVFAVTGLIVSVLFVYFYFIHPRIDNPDIEAILASSRERMGGDHEFSNLRMLWLDSTLIPNTIQADGQMWIGGHPTAAFFKLMKTVIANLLVCIPMIIMLARYWIRVIKSETKSYRKFLLAISSISVLMIIPLIIYQNDEGRWFYDIVFFEIVLLGSMFLLNFNNERKHLTELTKITAWKGLLLICYLIIYFQIGIGLNDISLVLKKILFYLGIISW